MTDAEARCPDCNTPLAPGAELCPECGTVITETKSSGETMDLGIELVQGSGYQEDEFLPSPDAAAATPPPTSIEPAIPATPPPPPPQPPATTLEPAIPDAPEPVAEPRDSGFNFESMTDPDALAEAAAAAAMEAEALELESMIPAADPPDVSPPEEDIHTAATVKTPAQPAPEEDLLDLDMDMEMLDEGETGDAEAVAPAPPPTVAERAVDAPPAPPRRPSPPETRPTDSIPDEVPPRHATDGAPAREGDAPEKPIFKQRTEKKKSGPAGILMLLVLVLALGVTGWYFAGAPGADSLRALGIPVPGGTEQLRYITNNLADPIQIWAGGEPYAVADPGIRLAVPARAGTPLSWHLVKPRQAGGLMAGENFEADLTEFTVEGEDEYYEVTYQSVEYWMFTPLITNPTDRPMTAIVNVATPRRTPCNCLIPPGAQNHHIGYYPFEAGIDIRFYDAENFDANRYREALDVTTDVAEGSGAVEVMIPRR